MLPRAHRLATCFALLIVGCGTTQTTSAVVGNDTGVAAQDTAVGDTATDTGNAGGEDTAIVETDTGPVTPREAPELATPARSALTEALYCGLSTGQLVQGALRGSECLGIPTAGTLDDISRGLFFGEVLTSGYARATFGSCAFLRCLNDATDCDAAQACATARDLGPCDATAESRRCDGSMLEACLWNGTAYRWYRTTDCAHLDAACVERFCPNGACLPTATCVREPMATFCDYYGRCEGNRLVRCMPYDGASTYAYEVSLDCGELLEGGTCAETPVGGEIPAPACTVAEPDCVNSFGGGGCVSDTEISLCLFGRQTTLDCTDFGYSRCKAGESTFEAGCAR